MSPAIRGWSPKTSFLLSNPSSGGGYDIIDHTFGPSFPSGLMNELQQNGWFNRLNTARTKMDVDLEKLLPLQAEYRTGVRGDQSVFIPRDVRGAVRFREEHPLLCRFIQTIESTIFDSLSDHIEIKKDLTSVQLARYPGDGASGYPRHCDSGAMCQRENNSSSSLSITKDSAERILTFVYYLTPDDWDAELDGGALRLYSSSDESAFDVIPHSDRMIVFRSDCIEHEVLPSFRRDRVAITVWIYGSTVNQINNREVPNDRTVLRSSFDPTNLPPPLPVPKLTIDTATDERETIFVAIPSYRDPETWPTILSLLITAHNPERVYIGVVWQIDTSSPDEIASFANGERRWLRNVKGGSQLDWDIQKHFRSLTMDFKHATGPCYARHLAQTLHRGEEFVLQIDSHMRFRPSWDKFLIRQLKKCPDPVRAVLTSYPPNYDAPHGPGPNAETRPTLLVPWKFDNDGILRQKGRLLRSRCDVNVDDNTDMNDNIASFLFAAGFNFCHSSMLGICPYDHTLHGLFFGEEISMAVRLFTHGYDLYSPPETVCYHRWKRNPLRNRDINKDEQFQFDSQRHASIAVVKMQLQGLGRGLGDCRSVTQFSQNLGVDFNNCCLSQGCEDGKLTPDAFVGSFLLDTKKDCLECSEMSNVLELVGQFIS